MLGRSRRRVEMKLAAGEWTSRDSGRRGRNGKPIRDVLLSSLPEDLQLRWAQAAARERVAEPAAESAVGGGDSAEFLAAALSRYPAELREALIAEINRLNGIVDRFDVLRVKSSLNEAGERVFVPEVIALCHEAACTDPIILAREPKRGKFPSPFTLEGWSRRRKKDGLIVFLRAKPTASATDGRRADFSPDAFDWLNANWRNFPTRSHCIKKLKKVARANKWRLPSDATVRRILDRIPLVVRAAVFGTLKDYTSKWKPYVPRTVEDLAALQIVVGDHHVLDVLCWSSKLKQLVRLWLTGWQDMRSGLIWGSHLDYTPSSHTIACAYANGVRNFGAQPFSRPADGYVSFAYTDNGKDYKAQNTKGEIEVHKQAAKIDGGLQLILTTQQIGLLNDAGVEQMLANLYNGREKPIERTFNDLATAIQNHFFKRGWCGRNTKDRPDAYNALYLRHKKAIKRGDPSPFPMEEEVRGFVADWIDEYNTSTHVRSTLGGARVVPLTEFNRLYTTEYKIADETLALMLLKPTSGTIGKLGVKMFGGIYVHAALSEFKGKKGPDGKALQIEARYSDENYLTVWLILPDGRVCEAQRLEPSSVLQPNKGTQKAVAMLTKHESKLIRDFNLLTQSQLRGETTEERAAVLMEVVEPVEMELPVAVNETQQAKPVVQKLSRLDPRRLRVVSVARTVTATEMASVETDAEIFSAPDRGHVSEFDFEE